jgi:nucleoside 2-deoxyribosyltransferase
MNRKVVISGSFRRYGKDVETARKNFERIGVSVSAPLSQKSVKISNDFVFLETDDPNKTAEELEEEFMEKIKQADMLYVADVDGYIGRSVATEMGLALLQKIPIILSEKIKHFSEDVPRYVQEIFGNIPYQYLFIERINRESLDELKIKHQMQSDLSSDEAQQLQRMIKQLLESLKNNI